MLDEKLKNESTHRQTIAKLTTQARADVLAMNNTPAPFLEAEGYEYTSAIFFQAEG